jgi:hypothetical protein
MRAGYTGERVEMEERFIDLMTCFAWLISNAKQ